MKRYFYNILLAVLVFSSLICLNACTCDDTNIVNTEISAISINPEVKAKTRTSSNSIAIGFEYYKVQDGINKLPDYAQSKVPNAITQEEKEYVLNYLKNHPNEGGTECDLTTYFIQNIGSAFDTYSTVDWNNANHYITGGNQMDYVVINGNHINDYNAVWGPDALCVNLPLVNPSYHDSYGNNTYSYYRFYTINGNYYLCFDYATHKDSGNENLLPDGVYNDWVIKLTPAEDIEPEPEPDITPITEELKGSVEVNLSINDEKEKDDYTYTKTSIHVRDTVDFEMYIPVPAEYYCQVDDMYVVEKHWDKMTYNESSEVVERMVNNNLIKLTITYGEYGITIKSEGINADVLKYCRKEYGDGITFEVWNYYTISNRTLLKTYFDRSTIKFTNEPGLYVNTKKIDLDCTVVKID